MLAAGINHRGTEAQRKTEEDRGRQRRTEEDRGPREAELVVGLAGDSGCFFGAGLLISTGR
jgi:hypothetical protein